MENNKGITLISLMITIIILIILSGIAIYLSIGNNGIFTRAKQASNKYKNVSQNEEEMIDKYVNIIDKYTVDSSKKMLAEEFEFLPSDVNWKVKNIKQALDYLYNN